MSEFCELLFRGSYCGKMYPSEITLDSLRDRFVDHHYDDVLMGPTINWIEIKEVLNDLMNQSLEFSTHYQYLVGRYGNNLSNVVKQGLTIQDYAILSQASTQQKQFDIDCYLERISSTVNKQLEEIELLLQRAEDTNDDESLDESLDDIYDAKREVYHQYLAPLLKHPERYLPNQMMEEKRKRQRCEE